jgi:hypothetical protein
MASLPGAETLPYRHFFKQRDPAARTAVPQIGTEIAAMIRRWRPVQAAARMAWSGAPPSLPYLAYMDDVVADIPDGAHGPCDDVGNGDDTYAGRRRSCGLRQPQLGLRCAASSRRASTSAGANPGWAVGTASRQAPLASMIETFDCVMRRSLSTGSSRIFPGSGARWARSSEDHIGTDSARTPSREACT